eukprot:CAMPEP_0201571858 /NCGR_PEP_ID=MMETSP0190_2-20130828/14830_1 /ASSEMBLY_ACC=CAM_ASM_000263 /TAXON_ID=37353 /ORGANISM="Rosalina sp." /LENGTH=139 /DNA_ID=CAMNT_0047996971 /DNA_START=945 /DNA_END=1361 /DNA_ORIENTATION=-
MAQPRPNNGNFNDNRQFDGVWRTGIPRSRSEEDEDLQRALAASLGQTYVPPPTKARNNYDVESGRRRGGGGGPISGIDNYYNKSSNNLTTHKIEEEPFEAQEKVSYKEALEMLLNGDCCFGLYDEKIKRWRTAVYMNHW